MRDHVPILRAEQIRHAEQRAMAGGVSSLELMERAGQAVANAVTAWSKLDRALVLCGPGNNGGDGFVVARLLRRAGLSVRVLCLASPAALTGAAAHNAARWAGPIEPLSSDIDLDVDVIIDAVFGVGFNKPVSGPLVQLFDRINRAGVPVVAVDIPSGVAADTGQVLGTALKATLTITFTAKKPGHVLIPGRALSGTVVIAEIGVPRPYESCWQETGAWDLPPAPAIDSYKHQRGHALVVSGPAHATGAARLTARAALRAGAGLVTVLSPTAALAVNAAHLTAVMLQVMDTPEALVAAIADPRATALAMGPGQGVGTATVWAVLAALDQGKPVVLDADALTSFEGAADRLFGAIVGPTIMTPHAGEFAKLFGPSPAASSKPELALLAAKRSGAIVLLKGPDTCIASPDGRLAINTTGTPDLATAGSGDVLAGLIVGFLATPGMDAFQAACAGAWLHGRCAELLGRGLIAEDLVEAIPRVFRAIDPPS